MSKDNRKSEFRRYRRALAITYLTIAGAGLLWLSASVVHGLWGGFAAEANAAPVNGDCIERANALAHELHARTAAALAPGHTNWPEDGSGYVAATPIETFFADWHNRQRSLEATCSTDEGAARAARALAAVGVGYQNLLTQFERGHATALDELRRALDENDTSGGDNE